MEDVDEAIEVRWYLGQDELVFGLMVEVIIFRMWDLVKAEWPYPLWRTHFVRPLLILWW